MRTSWLPRRSLSSVRGVRPRQVPSTVTPAFDGTDRTIRRPVCSRGWCRGWRRSARGCGGCGRRGGIGRDRRRLRRRLLLRRRHGLFAVWLGARGSGSSRRRLARRHPLRRPRSSPRRRIAHAVPDTEPGAESDDACPAAASVPTATFGAEADRRRRTDPPARSRSSVAAVARTVNVIVVVELGLEARGEVDAPRCPRARVRRGVPARRYPRTDRQSSARREHRDRNHF